MEANEKEAIVKKNVDSIMPIVKKLYENTDVWSDIYIIITNVTINSDSDELGLVAYATPNAWIHVTSSFFRQGPEGQKRVLLHELAHSYVTLTDPIGKQFYGNTHKHPEFINKFTKSLRLLGLPIKEPTVEKLQYILYTPTELPSDERVRFHNYYCPICKDVVTSTTEDFREIHRHAFKQ